MELIIITIYMYIYEMVRGNYATAYKGGQATTRGHSIFRTYYLAKHIQGIDNPYGEGSYKPFISISKYIHTLLTYTHTHTHAHTCAYISRAIERAVQQSTTNRNTKQSISH